MKLHGDISINGKSYTKGTDIPWYKIYTFLLRNAVLDLMKAREDDIRKKRVEYVYIAASVAVYTISHFLERS